MNKVSLLIVFAFLISFCCACNAVTPGPSTTRSSAAAVATAASNNENTVPEADVTTPAASTEEIGTESTEDALPENGERVVALDAVNVRDGMGTTDTNIVGTLNEGDVVIRVGEQDGWSAVIYDGNQYYVASAYLAPEEE